jgi:hypothetical protein
LCQEPPQANTADKSTSLSIIQLSISYPTLNNWYR